MVVVVDLKHDFKFTAMEKTDDILLTGISGNTETLKSYCSRSVLFKK